MTTKNNKIPSGAVLVTQDILNILWARRGTGTWTQLAEDLGVSTAYLSDVTNKRRPPGPKILRALGLKLSKREYVPSFVIDYDTPQGRKLAS